jgi:hypothetical protein
MMATYEIKIVGLPGNDPFAGGNLANMLNDLGSQGFRIAGVEGRYVFMEREIIPAEREERPAERPALRR